MYITLITWPTNNCSTGCLLLLGDFFVCRTIISEESIARAWCNCCLSYRDRLHQETTCHAHTLNTRLNIYMLRIWFEFWFDDFQYFECIYAPSCLPVIKTTRRAIGVSRKHAPVLWIICSCLLDCLHTRPYMERNKAAFSLTPLIAV